MSSLYSVKAILLLDEQGENILAKYYSDEWPTVEKKREFEKGIWTKSQQVHSQSAELAEEILMLDNLIAVYRANEGITYYIIGSMEENELLLASILSTLLEVLGTLLRNKVDKRSLLDNFDTLLLSIDEMIDEGIILESETSVIVGRVNLKGTDADVPLSEQSLTQALSNAREQISRSLMKN